MGESAKQNVAKFRLITIRIKYCPIVTKFSFRFFSYLWFVHGTFRQSGTSANYTKKFLPIPAMVDLARRSGLRMD